MSIRRKKIYYKEQFSFKKDPYRHRGDYMKEVHEPAEMPESIEEEENSLEEEDSDLDQDLDIEEDSSEKVHTNLLFSVDIYLLI